MRLDGWVAGGESTRWDSRLALGFEWRIRTGIRGKCVPLGELIENGNEEVNWIFRQNEERIFFL